MDSDCREIGFDDVQINEWCAIEQSLIEDMDGNELIFNEMKTLSRHQLGCIDMTSVPDARAFFDRLENNFEEEYDRLEFLINLTKLMEYHINCGSQKVTDLLKKHKKRLEKFSAKCEEEGLFKDKYFIGRNENVRDIQQKLIQGKVTGVCICGLGGMGKTSVAREVCIGLWKNKHRWIPKKIDLREVRRLEDLLIYTLAKLGEYHKKEKTEELTQQLFNLLENGIKTQTVLLFDNIDDVMEEDMGKVLRFFSELVGVLERHSKVKVLVTYRQKLVPPEDAKYHQPILSEVELKPLSVQDSVALLNKYTSRVDISSSQAQEIVRLCGCTPLAIRTLGIGLKSRLINADKVIYNLRYGFQKACLTETLNIRHCIKQTFDTMGMSLQNELIQISVFKTAPFDINAASAILDTKADVASLQMLCLKSRHFVEVDTNYDSVFCDFAETMSLPSYSLHPIVFAFLSEQIYREDEYFQNIYSKAKVKFAQHFYNIAVKAGREKHTNFEEFQKIIENHRSHLSIFFDISDIGSDVIERHGANTEANKRLYDTLCFIKDDDEIQKYANKMATDALNKGDDKLSTYWKVLEGLSFLESERINEAWDVVDEIEETIHNLQFDDSDTKLKAEICGEFCFLKGRLFIHKDIQNCALECFEQAVSLYSARNIKQHFTVELAKVHNSIGTAYFNYDYHSAKTHQIKALQLAETFYKGNHPDIANYMVNLAHCLFIESKCLKSMGKSFRGVLNQALEYYNNALDLDIKLNIHKTQVKDHAIKLVMRAQCKQALGYYDEAIDDDKMALELRQRVFKEPNDLLTISTHRIGNTFGLKAIKEYRSGKDAVELFEEAISYYDKAMKMIAEGGLSSDRVDEYMRIRDDHQKLAKHVYVDKSKQRSIETFYNDYQSGKFKKAAARNRERHSFFSNDFLSSIDASSDSRSSSSSDSKSTPSTPTDINEEHQSENENLVNKLKNFTCTFASDGSAVIVNDQTEYITEETIGNISSDESQYDSAMSPTDRTSSSDMSRDHIRQLENEGIRVSKTDDDSQNLGYSLSYQSSLEDEVFSKPDDFGSHDPVMKPGYSSRYSSGYGSSVSLSVDGASTSKSTNYKIDKSPKSQITASCIPIAVSSTNKTKEKGKIIKRGSSQTTQLSAFVDKIINKKNPKLSRKLLGSSFDEDK